MSGETPRPEPTTLPDLPQPLQRAGAFPRRISTRWPARSLSRALVVPPVGALHSERSAVGVRLIVRVGVHTLVALGAEAVAADAILVVFEAPVADRRARFANVLAVVEALEEMDDVEVILHY